MSRVSPRAAGLSFLAVSVVFAGGCDKLKAAIGGGGGGSTYVDPWQRDSTLMANSPAILYRVYDHPKGTAVAPLATLGQGLRRLVMTDRGWKAFDLNYLQEGHTLDAIQEGRVAGTVQMTRGFWNVDGQLDTVPRANCMVPAGLGQAPTGVSLAVSGFRPKLNPVTALSPEELTLALSKVPTLIAPSQGIPSSMLGRYTREVHVINSGINARPSILISYNDPEVVSDSVQITGERPRQLTIILDKGTYGYRPTYFYKTVGNANDGKRVKFLDYLDVDNDGRAEIFLTAKRRQRELTIDVVAALRAEGDGWRLVWEAAVRCV